MATCTVPYMHIMQYQCSDKEDEENAEEEKEVDEEDFFFAFYKQLYLHLSTLERTNILTNRHLSQPLRKEPQRHVKPRFVFGLYE